MGKVSGGCGSRGRPPPAGGAKPLGLKVNIGAEYEKETLPRGPHLKNFLTLRLTCMYTHMRTPRESLHRCERTAAPPDLRDRCREPPRVAFYGLLSVAVTIRKSRLMHFEAPQFFFSSYRFFFFFLYPHVLRHVLGCAVRVSDSD